MQVATGTVVNGAIVVEGVPLAQGPAKIIVVNQSPDGRRTAGPPTRAAAHAA
jgi:hypothetical protein